jgi:arylsulfatase A-like enzyme
MMIGVDDALGAVMAELRSDALVIYVGDNGFEPQANSSGPYRGPKGTLYEGGVRVPMIVSWPGHLALGAKYTHPVSTLDLYATIINSSRLDSVNLMPFLSGAVIGPAHRYLFWSDRTANGAVRSAQWKLYSYNNGSRIELYDTDADPSESNNVALTNQTLVTRLHRALTGWRATLATPF